MKYYEEYQLTERERNAMKAGDTFVEVRAINSVDDYGRFIGKYRNFDDAMFSASCYSHEVEEPWAFRYRFYRVSDKVDEYMPARLYAYVEDETMI